MSKAGIKGRYSLHGIVLLIAVWYAAAFVLQSPVVPLPHRVAVNLVQQLQRLTTYRHIAASLYRILCGTVLALLTGIPVGIAAGRSRMLDNTITPLLYLLYPVPKIALLPVFMVLLGIGDLAKISLIAVIIFFPIAVSIRDAVGRLSHEYLELARMLHLSQAAILRSIIIPGILPSVFSTLRISLGISLSVLFISENIASGHGLGFAIMNSWIMADYLGMYTGIVLLSLSGIGLYQGVDQLERRCTPWRQLPYTPAERDSPA